MGYADSVMRHYAQISGGATAGDLSAESATEMQSVNSLSSFVSLMPPPAPSPNSHSYRQLAGNDNSNPGSIVADGDDDSI